MWRTLIVEDDPLAAADLRQLLARYGREHDEQFTCEVMGSAMDFLEGTWQADLVFLDIDLPGISGMEAAGLWRLADQVTPLIFVTNLAQYALQGYAVDALDFMVKPVSYKEFEPRMDRALRVMARNARSTMSIATPEGTHIVDRRDIVYVEVLRHQLFWHLADPEHTVLTVRGTLTAAAEELGTEQFCRISASHLVNMGHVVRLRGNEITMSDGSALSISRSRKKEAVEALARYAGGGV